MRSTWLLVLCLTGCPDPAPADPDLAVVVDLATTPADLTIVCTSATELDCTAAVTNYLNFATMCSDGGTIPPGAMAAALADCNNAKSQGAGKETAVRTYGCNQTSTTCADLMACYAKCLQ